MIRVIWKGFWIDLLGDLLFHSGDCCTNMRLADMHGFTCCGYFTFDAAIALSFLLFCHPGPARVFCLIDVLCAQCTCCSLRRAVGTACLHVCLLVCTCSRHCLL